MGFADDPKHGMVKLYCPRCRDVYNCNASQRHIDGAFFGPTFPHIFFMSFDECVPDAAMEPYVPRVFGFRIHPSSTSIPRGQPASRGGAHGGLHAGGGVRGQGLGGLSEASTGAGTGYDQGGRLVVRGAGGAGNGGAGGGGGNGGGHDRNNRSSAASGGATGEEADEGAGASAGAGAGTGTGAGGSLVAGSAPREGPVC